MCLPAVTATGEQLRGNLPWKEWLPFAVKHWVRTVSTATRLERQLRYTGNSSLQFHTFRYEAVVQQPLAEIATMLSILGEMTVLPLQLTARMLCFFELQ